jgi:long-chain fatty acid transport protein
MSPVQAVVRIAVAITALLGADAALAGGLYVPIIGTPTTGTSGAGANARAADASTAVENPAGMTRLDDHQLVTSLAPGFADVQFDVDESPAGGGDGGQQGGFVPISSNQYVHKLSDRWRLGLSLLSISGAGLDPNNDWAGRNEVTEESLLTLTLAPTAAFRVCDWLSVGGGVGITYGRLDMKLRLPFGVLGEPTLKLKDMDDVAVAPIASILLEPLDNLRIGVLYQGETDLHLKGKGRLGGMESNLKLNLPLAQAVRSSILFAPTERVTLLGSAG